MTAMTTVPDAIVFDVDGILVDTEPAWDVVRRGLAREDGVPWPESSTTAMMGMSTPEWSTHLSEVVGLHSTPEESAQRTIDGLLALYRTGVEVLPGARDAVARAAALTRVGLASSSAVVLIDAAVRTVGIEQFVSERVSTEQVPHGKPWPDGYLRCCELLSAEPTRSVAVEDSSSGIRSALAAGMKVVAVPQPFHAPGEELLAQCAAVLSTLDELTDELLLGLLEG